MNTEKFKMLNAIKTGSTVPRIELIARRIEKDIKNKNLKTGDKYMTTLQVARTFKIGNEIANRAMQLLAQRNVIERKHRAGTFVGNTKLDINGPLLQKINLIVQKQSVDTYGVLRDGTISGLHGVLPGTQIQFSFLPETDHRAFIDKLISDAFTSDVTEGFVLYRSDPDIQKAVSESGLPAVISGSRWQGIDRIPCIDENCYSRGKLLVEHLIGKGHKKIAFITSSDMFPSDLQIYQAIRDVVDGAGFRPCDFSFLSLPLKSYIIQNAARTLFQSKDAPTAVICREKILALNTKKVSPADTDIVMVDFFQAPQSIALFPYTHSKVGPEMHGEILGKMLAEMASKPGQIPKDYLEDIELVEPPNFSAAQTG